MKVPVSWLHEFVSLDASLGELADACNELGLVVEAIQHAGAEIENVVTARVVEVRPHPNADRLRVCEVDDGSSLHHVVCGAWNFDAGVIVPYARPPARLPGGRDIGQATLRGEQSEGMLCSAAELGVSDDAAGILVFAPETPLGKDVTSVLGLDDPVLHLEIESNRPDAMGIQGIARDLAARFRVPWQAPPAPLDDDPSAGTVPVTIADAQRCPRFTARVIRGVTVAPSPEWMQRRLLATGVRPISNVVDVSNYVMLELGQPLHTFDLDLLEGPEIVVRRARAGERLTTLDGQQRVLDTEDVVVADAARPVGLAGVMGGSTSEVSANTVNVLLEGANWQPAGIMRTSKRHGLVTEASVRFQRGQDPNACLAAVDRAAYLIAELAGGKVGPAIDEYPHAREPGHVALRPARVNAILGREVPGDRQVEHLRALGFEVREDGDGTFDVIVPTFRPDVRAEVDLVEEVARLEGYESFPSTLPETAGRIGTTPPLLRALRLVRATLAGARLHEVEALAFLAPADFDILGLPADDPRRNGIPLQNPLREEESVLRSALLPGLLRIAQRNVARRTVDLGIFEIGRVFLESGDVLPEQPYHVAVLLHGHAETPGVHGSGRRYDVHDLTGILAGLGDALGVEVTLDQDRLAGYRPGRAARVIATGRVAGEAGELAPSVLESLGLEAGACAAELDFDVLTAAVETTRARPVSVFPPAYLDLAWWVPPDASAGRLSATIRGAAGPLLEDVKVFDDYRSPEGRRSLAYRLTFRSLAGTLRDSDLAGPTRAVEEAVAREHDAELRSLG